MKRTALVICILLVSISKGQSTQYSFWKPVHYRFDSIVNEMERLPLNTPRIIELVDSLGNIAEEVGLPILKCRYLYWKANIEAKDPTTRSSNKSDFLQEALALLDTVKYRYDYARIRYLMVNPVQSNENYIEQYKNYLKLLSEFESFNDVKYQADINRWLGILMSELGENEKALEYLLKANSLYEKTNQRERIATNMISIAIVYNSIGRKEEAVNILENTLRRTDINLDTSDMIAIYTSLNNALINLEKKIDYAKEAYLLAILYKNDYMKNITRLNMGVSYLLNNRLDSAKNCFEDVYFYAVENKNHRLLLPSLYNLSLVYDKKGVWREAYSYLTQYLHVKDSLQGSGKISEINKIEASIAIKEYQNQLIIADQKSELRRKQVLITILVAIGLVLGSLLVLLYILQKKKITESQLKNEELHSKNLQQEVDFQNRELSSTTLILSEKNGILNSLLAQMERFRNEKEMSNSCELALRKLITDNLRSENEWESFKLHFDKVHPDFFYKLKNLSPNLSENELRLCAYIRIGMTSKQIGQMISVLPATINTNRYLLRKKFGLKPEVSLDDYIREI